MFCFVALIIFAILGIFSASHRTLAKEALDCVFRRVTLRPCNTGFKEKMQSKILGKLIMRSPRLAKAMNHHFELLAWIFFILSVASTAWVIKDVYNVYVYGNCNGLNSTEFCAFDLGGINSAVSSIATKPCSLTPTKESNLSLNRVDLSSFPTENIQAKSKVVFIGCYLCDYSREAYPLIKKIVKENNVQYTFALYPTKSGSAYLTAYMDCAYKQDSKKFWQWNDAMFSSNKSNLLTSTYVQDILVRNGYNLRKIMACVNSTNTADLVNYQINQLTNTGIYGTPTVFINGKPFVGPKPYRVYQFGLKPFIFF